MHNKPYVWWDFGIDGNVIVEVKHKGECVTLAVLGPNDSKLAQQIINDLESGRRTIKSFVK